MISQKLTLSLTALTVTAALSGAVLSGCGTRADATSDSAAPEKTATVSSAVKTAPDGTPVEAIPVRRGDATRHTAVTGSLVALQDVTLSSKLSGRLAEVLVREGDTVRPGQIVARLDTTDLAARVRSAEDAVTLARARVAQAEAGYRQQVVTSRANVDSAEAEYSQQQEMSRSNVEAAEAELASARARLSQVREGARRQEVGQAESRVAIARATLARAKSDHDRNASLHDQGAISTSALEQYETVYQVAVEELRAAEQNLSLVKEGARSQEVEQTEQAVRQAGERLRQARSARAQDRVRKAQLQGARAARAQDEVRASEIQGARAALGQAQSELIVARQALADAQIIAPLAGQVASRSAEPGQIAGAGETLLRIVALDTVFFEPTVPEREVGRIRPGQPVEVRVDAFPDKLFQGKVTRVYPAGSGASRAFPVRITLSNPERLLRPEMFARGRIVTERQGDVLLVPREALLRDNGSNSAARLFTAEDGIARERKVSLGAPSPDGKWFAVSGGSGANLSAGIPVVTMGQRGLKDGEKVTVR